jgi:hypothetical protein
MRIALATCSELPSCEVDDVPLHHALVKLGVEVLQPCWDDPAFDWAGVDACLIRTTWDYHLHRDEFVAWAQRVERLTALFNPAALVLWNTNKLYLRDLAECGVAVIDTLWLDRGASVDLGALLDARGWQRGFFKPVVGATAYRTCRFENHGDSLTAAQVLLDSFLVTEAMQFQPYLNSVETHGEESMFFIDGAYSHSVRKIPALGDYRVQDDFGASDQVHLHTSAEIEQAAVVLRLVEQNPAWVGEAHRGSLLYARVDWLRDAAGALRLCEFEAVEPCLFFRHAPQAAQRLAQALLRRVSGK